MRWIAIASTVVVTVAVAWYWLNDTSMGIASADVAKAVSSPDQAPLAKAQEAAALAAGKAVPQPAPTVDAVMEAVRPHRIPLPKTQVDTTVVTRSEEPEPEVAITQPFAPLVESKKWVIVTGSRVYIRDEPGNSGRRLISYARDTKLERLEKTGSWLKVKHPDTGKTGWMYKKYLKEVPSVTIKANPPAG